MELDAVPESEVWSAVDDGVSVVSGEFEPPSDEEVFEVPEFRDHPRSAEHSVGWTPLMLRS